MSAVYQPLGRRYFVTAARTDSDSGVCSGHPSVTTHPQTVAAGRAPGGDGQRQWSLGRRLLLDGDS